MRAIGWATALLASAALGACATQDSASGQRGAEVAAAGLPAPNGIVRTGASIASMSDQYARPRTGQVAATGAGAWVAVAPAPAYVSAAPLPPADPAPPPLAAVANRQPGEASSAAEVVRPEAAQPDTAAPAVDTAAGRDLFNQWTCGACHALADANAAGAIGPSLDGSVGLTREAIVRIVTGGQGAMPGFGGQIDDADIAVLADYILAVKK